LSIRKKLEATGVRFGMRISLDLPVDLNVEARTLGRGMIRNASHSGALIETSLELPLNTPLVMILSMPGGDAPATRALTARVVRIDAFGIGVEWRDMAGADIVELLQRASSRAATY
jgi:hypothetical protein